jgi:type VI secretion system secreted protein Hcp
MAADNFLWFPSPASGGLLTGKATQPEGESTDDWFSKKKAVELASFGFGVAQADTSGSGTSGASAGKAKFEEFTVEKDVDQASAPLFQACTAGAHYPSIVLIVRKPGGQNLLYVQFIFRQVFVTGVNWSGGGGEENPKESIKFKFGAMGIQYVQQLATGGEGTKMVGWWSAITNQPTSDVVGLPSPPDFLNGAQSA